MSDWNKEFLDIMNNDIYKLSLWKSFKTNDARDYVVKFVIKTLDIIAYPTLVGETLDKNLFQIS